MFYPESITSIKPNDKVLEVGPGGTPHPRSDCFLEKIFDTEEEWEVQRGLVPKLNSEKKTFYYDGNAFPFKDKEFDYVICSHVVEHVENIHEFISELFRVASRGYIEFPTIYYEYLYNFKYHVNFVKYKDGSLYYLKKSETNIDDFYPVQKMLYNSLGLGHSTLVDDLKHLMIEGFEWEKPFPVLKSKSFNDLVSDAPFIPVFSSSESRNVNYSLLFRVLRRLKRYLGLLK